MKYQDELQRHRDLIEYLFSQLWDLLTDGDDPDLEVIKEKLIELDFDPEKLMIY